MKALKHIDAVLMAGDRPVTKKTVALSVLDSILTGGSTSLSGRALGSALSTVNRFSKDRVRQLGGQGTLARGYNVMAEGSVGSGARTATVAADILHNMANLSASSKAYKKNLKERRRLAAGLAGLLVGTSAGAGALSSAGVNKLMKMREASKGKMDLSKRASVINKLRNIDQSSLRR